LDVLGAFKISIFIGWSSTDLDVSGIYCSNVIYCFMNSLQTLSIPLVTLA
jgi:hypothetical protein